jgi:chromosomal replication initiator protein
MVAEWLEVLPRLRQQVGERNFATWIEPIRCSMDANGLCLETPSRFFQEWVTRHFMATIQRALAEGGGPAVPVRVTVAAEQVAEQAARRPPATARPARAARPPRGPQIGRLVPDYTFDSFVVGHANEVAYHAARSVAEGPGQRFNPFFLWGGVGLGKTHLINALAHDLLSRTPRRGLACLSAEAFINTLVYSLRQDQMAAFREKFREVDILILDDVQFLAGKERTQEEFFHTFNALRSNGSQIVLTSDKPPHAMADLEQRLRSRFEGGLIVDIHPPTHAMRIAIALKKATMQRVDLPLEVAQVIAERSGPSVRELEGALTQVIASALLRGLRLNVALAESVLAPNTPPPRSLSIETVQEAVSRRFQIPLSELKSHRRSRTVAFPRQVAMYLSRTVSGASFASIAEKFGGRDHSTVMYAVQRLEERRADPNVGQVLDELERQLKHPRGC